MIHQVLQSDSPQGRPLKSPKKKGHFGVRVKRTSLWQNLGEVWVNRIHVESFFQKQNHNVGTQTPGQKHRLCNTTQDKPFFEDSHALSKPFNRKLWVILLIERNYAPINNRYSFSLTSCIYLKSSQVACQISSFKGWYEDLIKGEPLQSWR